MSALRKAIVTQFGRPHGVIGGLAGWTMANRPSNRERNAWTVDLLDIRTGDAVLELGCGPGLALQGVLAAARHVTVVGVDHSPLMLIQARKRNREAAETGRLRLFELPASELGRLAGPFDKALAVNVMQFMDPVDRARVYALLHGLLAPDGALAITFMPRNRNPTREDALRFAALTEEEMRRAGFAEVRSEERSFAPVSAMCTLGRRCP